MHVRIRANAAFCCPEGCQSLFLELRTGSDQDHHVPILCGISQNYLGCASNRCKAGKNIFARYLRASCPCQGPHMIIIGLQKWLILFLRPMPNIQNFQNLIWCCIAAIFEITRVLYHFLREPALQATPEEASREGTRTASIPQSLLVFNLQ